MRNWPVGYRAVDRAERAEPDTMEFRVGPLPVGILGGQNLAVATDTPYRAEAERVVRFLTGIPAQKLLATFGFAPTAVDAYTDPAVKAAIPHLTAIRNAVEQSRPRPPHNSDLGGTGAPDHGAEAEPAGTTPHPGPAQDDSSPTAAG